MGNKLKIGDQVEASWSDGLVLTGSYCGSERGYIILTTKEGKKIVCDPSAVTFKVIQWR